MRGGTELGKVRGLGSARSGAHHWTVQRLTALANVALFTWAFISFLRIDVTSGADVARWLSDPLIAVAMVLLILNVFWHIRLGLQVLIEDYVHGGLRLAALVALNFYCVAGAAFGLFAVARIAFTTTTGMPS
jgi:succinate dehydrogenase / fumarate reductase, membrane anchor subunit